MGKLNMKDWIGQTILNKKVISIPIMTHPGIELIGKTVHDAVTNGQVHYEAIKALCDKYPSAAATVIMDLTVEAEAFGAEIVFPENEVPSVSGRLLADEAAIETLEIPALNKGRIAQYLKANMLTAKNITDRPVLAGCIGPYSLAGRLYDMSEIMMLIYINPEACDLVHRVVVLTHQPDDNDNAQHGQCRCQPVIFRTCPAYAEHNDCKLNQQQESADNASVAKQLAYFSAHHNRSLPCTTQSFHRL